MWLRKKDWQIFNEQFLRKEHAVGFCFSKCVLVEFSLKCFKKIKSSYWNNDALAFLGEKFLREKNKMTKRQQIGKIRQRRTICTSIYLETTSFLLFTVYLTTGNSIV